MAVVAGEAEVRQPESGFGVSGCPNPLRRPKQSMAYRRHTHSLRCRSPNVSGCL
ncbi:hypothetical protein [Kingella oralis]|uniref:hypothetical protein n=1 Tax=Kingella oralis TaxID=505 RepID=UPI0034E603AF